MEITKEYLAEQFNEQFKLTQEYFDKQFKVIEVRVGAVEKGMGSMLTKNGFDKKLSTLATKYDLDVQTRELKQYVHESFEVQQTYIDERTLEINDSMQIDNRLKQHEYWIDKIAKKTGVRLGQAN